jgi:CDP-paratose 2-epimerase
MKWLITGGAGFIGSNLAQRLLSDGHEVTILDNLSRRGAHLNLSWLQATHGHNLRFVNGDVRRSDLLPDLIRGVDAVFHLAAQVAVTTSVVQPREDLEINLLGTFNVLEAIRALPEDRRPMLFYTSTNKVYGRMEEIAVVAQGTRYAYATQVVGVSEAQPLDFHSPYGCSKGAAEQYVLDYTRIYGLRTVVFRASCIYGWRQFGSEDQGWVAHFLISALRNTPVTIYGDGKQVRDILFIDDLLDAFILAADRIEEVQGEAFNVGGGPANTVSLLELLEWLDERCNPPVPRSFSDWRPGDQQIYISDIRKLKGKLDWSPRICIEEGLSHLWTWLTSHRELFSE